MTALSLEGKDTVVAEKRTTHCMLQVLFSLPPNALYMVRILPYLLEKLPIVQIFKSFPAFYGT
jgi:hypothetical protein